MLRSRSRAACPSIASHCFCWVAWRKLKKKLPTPARNFGWELPALLPARSSESFCWRSHGPAAGSPRTVPATPGIAILVWLGYINLALAAFNMIPGFPLDGGRVLRAIIWWLTKNVTRATNIAATIGQIVGVLFILYGIVQFFSGDGFGGIWMAFIGWFLLQAAGATRMQMRAENLLHGLHVADLMTSDCGSVDGSAPLQEFVDEHLLRTGRRCYVVTEHGQVAGLITPNEVRKIDRELWSQTSVHAAMRSLAEIHSVKPDTSVLTAMEMMTNEDVNQLPVMSDGHLDGVVSRSHILQVLRSRSMLSVN